MRPSVASRIYWNAWLSEDTRTMDAMSVRCPDVAQRCAVCGNKHHGASIVGPACREKAIRNGHARLIEATDRLLVRS